MLARRQDDKMKTHGWKKTGGEEEVAIAARKQKKRKIL